MVSVAKIFAANIAGLYYRVSDDAFVYSHPPTLAIKCKTIRIDSQIHANELNIICDNHYFAPKFDPKSLEQCKKIGKSLSDKKYSGPLDRYINGITGVAIKTPTSSHGEAKAKKPKYYYFHQFKVGIPRREFNEEDIPALETAFTILFGQIQIKVESPDKIMEEYFQNELKWCGTCKKHIVQFEIAHGLARKHGKGNSNTDPENLYRTCFDCNRNMIDEHILHYQHKLNTEAKKKFLANDPMSRFSSRIFMDMYNTHKKLCDLGIETTELDKYSDPLDVYKSLIIKENMAVLLKEYVPDDWVLVNKKDGKAKPIKQGKNKTNCVIL